MKIKIQNKDKNNYKLINKIVKSNWKNILNIQENKMIFKKIITIFKNQKRKTKI